MIDVVFGKCRRCGATPVGGYETLTGADAEGTDETQVDQKLVRFRGEYMCEMCKQDIINEDQSAIDSETAREEEAFRARIGYTNTIE